MPCSARSTCEGKNFYYDNPLTGGRARYPWHLPVLRRQPRPHAADGSDHRTYVKGDDGIYVNMFIGSTINVEKVAGTDIQMVQKSDYPWNGNISITVNPKVSKNFTVYVRIPNRTTSELYTPTPKVSGVKSLAVNGKIITPKIVNGYAVITRTWKAGDKIDMVLPMEVQRIVADKHIAADRGLVALRYGPLIYNVERADQPDITKAIGSETPHRRMARRPASRRDDHQGRLGRRQPALLAIPNFARNNRNSQGTGSMVWIKNQTTGEQSNAGALDASSF